MGEPDILPPSQANEMAIQGINNGFHKYTHVAGTEDLKRSIQKKLFVENELKYEIDEIIVSSGAKHSLYNAFMVLCNPGDEVIIPSPYWVTYPEQIKLAGAVPRIVKTNEQTNFKLTPAELEKSISSKTKILILNSPNNPSGQVYSKSELKDLASIIIKYNLYVISDEIYEKMVYGSKHYSIANVSPELKSRSILINGLSKAYGMTGWRVGYTAAPLNFIQAATKLQSHVTSNISSISQLAAIGAIENWEEKSIFHLEKIAERVYKRLIQMNGVTCIKPTGTFYVFPNISNTFGKYYNSKKITNADDFAELLLLNYFINIVPGT